MLPTTKMLKTKSFTLATYQQGDENADKLALVLPGRLDTKDYKHMHSHVEFFASKGFFALSFDPPGTWESPGDLSEYSMTSYLQAIKEIVDHFDKPTVLLGHSRGAAMATFGGTRIEKVSAFIAIMGKASFKNKEDEEWKMRGAKIHKRDTPEGYEEDIKIFDLSYDYIIDSRQYDAIEDLKVCTKPKLFIAGDDDPLAPAEMISEVYELSADPKEFTLLKSGHDYRHHDHLIEKVNDMVEEFIEKNNL